MNRGGFLSRAWCDHVPGMLDVEPPVHKMCADGSSMSRSGAACDGLEQSSAGLPHDVLKRPLDVQAIPHESQPG